jgi:hypothetical protein
MVADSRATASVKQPNRAHVSIRNGDTDVTRPSAPRTPATRATAKSNTDSGAACSPTPDVGKDRYTYQMKSTFKDPILGAPGWRALLSFWVLILSFGITTVLLLQALGPPSRHSERTVISSRPAETASGHQIGNPALPSPPPDRNPLRAIKDPATGAHPAVESLAQSSGPLSRAPSGDLEQAMDTKLQLYERAQQAAAAGKFDEADKALALADKLALHLLTPTVPPAGAAGQSSTGKVVAGSSGTASQRNADTGLLHTPLPSGRGSELAASRVPAAAPVPPADPQKGGQPPAGAAGQSSTGKVVAGSSGTASQRNADTGLLHTPLPSGRDSELAMSRVPAAAPVPPADPQKGGQPPAGVAGQSSTGKVVAGSSGTASQRNADTGLLHTPLPSGRDSELAASRVPAAAPVPPADPQNGAQRIADPILIIHFFKGSALAPTEVHQLTAILGSRFSQIKLAGEDRIRPNAIIQYYSLRDHPITRDIGRELGRMGYQWRIEQVTTQGDESPSDIVDVWIPPR